MMEYCNSNNINLANTVKGFKVFSGRVPSEFNDWAETKPLGA